MTSFSLLYVLDAYAILAFFQLEPGGSRVRDVLSAAAQGDLSLAMTVVNAAEVIYRTVRGFGLDRARSVESELLNLNIDFVSVDQSLATAAAWIKGTHAISFADCLVAALAQRLDATILTGDRDFERFGSQIVVEWLPIT